jgi:hypothetical protein
MQPWAQLRSDENADPSVIETDCEETVHKKVKRQHARRWPIMTGGMIHRQAVILKRRAGEDER